MSSPSRGRRVAWAGVTGLCLLATLAPSAARAETSADVPSGPASVARTWAPTHMSPAHAYTSAEATTLARRFDLVVGLPSAFDGLVPAMKSANPRLDVLAYVNATFVPSSLGGAYPSSWYAKDSTGRRITSAEFGNLLMEPSSLGWRNQAINDCRSRSAAAGYDGCMADMLTMGIFGRDYVTALPVNPATGSTYTQLQWREQLVALGRKYSTDLAGLVIGANTVQNGRRYLRHEVSSKPLALSVPAPLMEDFLRGGATAVDDYPAEAGWLDDVRTLQDLEANGRAALLTTKVWSPGTVAQKNAWHRYSMASFLLGANGLSFYAFTSDRTQEGATGANHAYTMPRNLGASTSAMTREPAGYYKREFANGMAVVNPTSAPVSLTLAKPHRRLGGAVVTSLVLPAHSGDVLVAEPTAPTPSPSTTPSPTASPSGAPSPSPAPDQGCGLRPTIDLPTSSIAGRPTRINVTGTPGRVVDVLAYTRPATEFRVVRSAPVGAQGSVSFDIVPPGNTRLYAQEHGCAPGPQVVLGVAPELSISAVRTGVRSYLFHGDSLPARPGGLLVNLYRVDAAGREILSGQARASASTGEWSHLRVFTGTGRFGFLVRTGQDMQNIAGASAVRSTLIF